MTERFQSRRSPTRTCVPAGSPAARATPSEHRRSPATAKSQHLRGHYLAPPGVPARRAPCPRWSMMRRPVQRCGSAETPRTHPWWRAGCRETPAPPVTAADRAAPTRYPRARASSAVSDRGTQIRQPRSPTRRPQSSGRRESSIGCRQKAQGRGRVGRAAAKAGTCREPFEQGEPAEPDPTDAVAERTRGLENEILVGRSCRTRARTVHDERKWRTNLEHQAVAGARKAHQAFELVIAVGAAADDAQRQVDLGKGRFGKVRSGANLSDLEAHPPSPGFLASADDVSSAKPDLSFCSIFTSSSGSGLRSRACDHWNLASSVRPTFQ